MRGERAKPPVLKRFGQHFLTDRGVLEGIAAAVATNDSDTIIEIGPGRGALTDFLATRPNRLIGIEIDRALAENLRRRYSSNDRVTIIEQDVLDLDLSSLSEGPWVVAGNVPYYITTPILFHVLKPPFPRQAVFLVQREVAQRIVSPPGSKTYGALSANLQAVSRAEILMNVPPRAFTPRPKVHSAVVRMTPRNDPVVEGVEVQRFRTFVQALFGMRRKQLGNSLRSASRLSAEEAAALLRDAGIDQKERAESLSPSQLADLMRRAAVISRGS